MSSFTLPTPPAIQTLSRSESTPSNVSDSSTFVGPYPSFSPTMTSGQPFNMSVDDVTQTKRGLDRLHTKQSLPNMLFDNALDKAAQGRTTAVSRPTASRAAQSSPIIASPSSRPDTKSKGGFSSFFKKLTGRSDSKVKTKPVYVPVIRQHTTPLPGRPNAVRSSSTSGAPVKPVLVPLNTNVLPSVASPFSAPAAPQPSTILAGPMPPTPQISKSKIDLPDPCQIPLPPSPIINATLEVPQSISEISTLPSSLIGRETTSTASAGSLKRAKPSGMLNLETSDDESNREQEILEVEEESEEADHLPDLQPIRIPSGGSRYHAPDTPASIYSTVEEIVTPTSGGESPLAQFGSKMSGSSPPRKAPIGSGPGLERKESKWRKSIMGLSDIGNSKKNSRSSSSTPRDSSMERRGPRREPPTSYDAYVAHQQRIANRRVSCQPTLHSNASIAAELRQIRDQDEKDVAEVFFLS